MDQPDRPTGTITFLFSDIEGSTELAATLGTQRYREALELHQRLLRGAFAAHGGIERSTEGDSFFVVFRNAPSAVAAAVDAQLALAAQAWSEHSAIRVRIGLHTGEGAPGGDDYVGLDVNRAARICSAAHGGQVLVSEATRALTAGSMPDGVAARDLGRHRLKGLPEREHIYQLTIPGVPSDFPAIRSLDASMTSLPTRVSSFIGRERELEEVARLVPGNALVTLLGPGGTGKTSLATEVARSVAPQFEDGTWFVPLDAIADHQLVGSAIVTGLGLRDTSGRSARERLLDNLPGRSLLLVVDNFEHVLDAAPLITELIVAAPTIRVIVTSRAPMRLSAEQVYPVAPLATPAGDTSDAEKIGRIPSVRLFVDRARRVQPEFELTVANAEAIADICRRLDGLPLGIELAAARIGMLGAAGIRDRLARHAGLGGSAARDAPARQRTLEGAIAWSHDLLDEPSRTLFARLAVFAGGWRLEQAELVCGPATELGADVLDTLEGLVEQSLVTTTARNDGVRFGMLETVRRDAAQRLAGGDREVELRRRHALAFLGLAESTAPALETRDGPAAIDRLQEERENLRSAVRFAIDTSAVEVGLRFSQALGRFWGLTGEVEEGASSILAFLSLPGADAPSVARMRALEACGNLFYHTGDSERTREMYQAQLELATEIDDKGGIADARYNLLFTDYGPSDFEAALTELDAIEARYVALGDDRMVARTMWARAGQLMAGGRASEAVEILERAIVRYRELGDYAYHGQTAGLLSAASFQLGDPASGARWLLEGITLALELANLPVVTVGLPTVAMAVFHLGLADAAATILGAYEGLARRYGVRMPKNLEQYLEAIEPTSQVRAALDANSYDEAFSRGTTMTVDEVVDFVMEIASRKGAAPASER